MRLAILTVTIVAIATAAGSDVVGQGGNAGSAPRFEVASIKPSPPSTLFDCKPPTCYTGFYQLFAGRFRATNMSVVDLIGTAYSMPAKRLVAPEWTSVE